jgi:glycosyltransferase involved in cell wall biosynthesis
MLEQRPLRVMFVITALEPGGSERQLTELVTRAHPARIDATVATLYPTRSHRHLDSLEAHGVRVRALSSGRKRLPAFASAAARLMRLLRAVRPDVAYAWLEEAATATVPVARGLRIPVAVARRNVCGASVERIAPLRVAIRRLEASTRIVTANSQAVREEAIRRGIAPERIRVVENGHEALPALAAPTTSSPVRLGYLAHLRAEKGHLRLLDVLARLPRENGWHADLGGSGPLEAAVRERIAELGLADRVALLGDVDDARAFWAPRHIAVLLSDHEGSSNTLIEAAMAGRPLVATDVGGNPGVVAPGGGLLVSPGDTVAIADALARLIADPGLRADLGTAAHRQAAERFSMERFVDGHVAALAEAAGRGPRPAGCFRRGRPARPPATRTPPGDPP